MVTIGRMQITGEVTKRAWRDSDYGLIPKMLVRDDRGFTVWSTVPKGIDPIPGERVTFMATIIQHPEHPLHARAERPTKGRIVTAEEPVQAMLAIA